ncbi:MAG: hypothetical protein Q9166_003530 [cf. Caloplaca sp. 2 TL-2023]
MANLPCNGPAILLQAQNLGLDLWVGYCLTATNNSPTIKRTSGPGVSAADMQCVKEEAGHPRHHPHLLTLLLTVAAVASENGMDAATRQRPPLQIDLRPRGTEATDEFATVVGTTIAADVIMSMASTTIVADHHFSGVDLDQVRHSLATLRQSPDRKAHLSTTIRECKTELRQSRHQHRDMARGMRNETKGPQGAAQGPQHKEMKAELKSFVKEARAVRKKRSGRLG